MTTESKTEWRRGVPKDDGYYYGACNVEGCRCTTYDLQQEAQGE